MSGSEPAPPVARVGVRDLRNNVASVVRRAAAGERVVVTVDGVAAAQLGPVGPLDSSSLTLDDLVATGLLHAPKRPSPAEPPVAEDVPVDIRPSAVLDELRGSR